jgi:hypothetical protein
MGFLSVKQEGDDKSRVIPEAVRSNAKDSYPGSIP